MVDLSRIKMAKPKQVVPKTYIPPGGKRITPELGDTWQSLAKKFCTPKGSDMSEEAQNKRGLGLAYFNYRSLRPEHINWYLHHNYGSDYSDDGVNLAFTSFIKKEKGTGTIFVPFRGPNQKQSAQTSGYWSGIGVQVSGRMLVGADTTYGVLYNSTPGINGASETIRYVDIMDEGYTFGAGLGGSGGLVFLFAHGMKTAADFTNWEIKWTDFTLAFGPNVSAVTKAIPLLAKIPGISGLGSLGKTLTHVQVGYDKVQGLADVLQNLAKNVTIMTPGLYIFPIPTHNSGYEIGLGGRAHLTTVQRAGIYDLKAMIKK